MKSFKLAIIALFLTLNALYATELPKEFLDSFNTYKKARLAKDAKSIYELQLPYFRYLNSFPSFKHYINALVEAKNIKITKILRKNAENIDIIIGLKLKNTKNMIYYKQNWYKLRDRYYLLTKDFMIFRDW